MRVLIHAFLLCCLLPTSLSARDIRVKSGEHESYSRLVIYTDGQDTPSLKQSGPQLRVTTGNQSDTFNVSGVFDLIPKTRIQSVSTDSEGALRIALACDCEIETQQLPGGQFVVDVADASSPSSRSTPKVTEGPTTPSARHQPRHSRLGLPIAPGIAMSEDRIPSEPDNTVARNNLPQTSIQILDEEKLLTQLSRAASQGLLSPSVSPPPDKVVVTIQGEDVEILDDEMPTLTDPAAKDHLKVQTVVDRDTAHLRSSQVADIVDVSCLPDQSFSIASWGTGSDNRLDFSFGHLDLVTEFDNLDPATFLRFLRHQLYLTLGAETLTQLNAYTDELPERSNLALIARVMEGTEQPAALRIADQIHCDGPSALWAILSVPRLQRDALPNTAAILTEFSALPRHLRSHLGPMLMRKYLSIGDTDNAMEINRITERGATLTAAVDSLSDARLSLASSEADKATTILAKIVDNDDQDAIDAATLLIEASIENQQGIPDRTLELLESLAHEHRATHEGYRLALAEIDAFVHTARFMELPERMVALREFADFDQTDYVTRLAAWGDALVMNASNASFLRSTLGQSIWPAAPEKTRTGLAERLIDLGFASEARNLLLTEANPPGRTARLLIAQIALAQDDAKVALGYLAGLDSEQTQSLRDAALHELDLKSTAQAKPKGQIDAIQKVREAPPSLADYRALLDQSEVTRQQVETRLDSAPAPLAGL